jgi:hypothetical protein
MKAMKAKTAALWAVGLTLMGMCGFVAACPSAASAIVSTVVSTTTPKDGTQGPGNGTVITIVPNLSINNAQVSAHDVETGQITILSYVMAKGVAKKLIAKAKAGGQCMTIGAGTKIPGFWNSGKKNGVLFWFWDTRTTTVCKIHGVWRKVGPNNCGNLVRFTKPPSHVLKGTVLVVRSRANVTLRLRAFVLAVATGSCGYARAESEASIIIQARQFVRTHGRSFTKLYMKLKGKVTADVRASVNCGPAQTTIVTATTGSTTTVTMPVTTTVHTTTTVPATTTTPKDGTQGPGTGTPGQPGGPGAGGSPGTGSGPVCRDQNGNIVPGTPVNTNGDCAGVTTTSSTTTTAQTTTQSTTTTSQTCIDPVTGVRRSGPPDQFGYCY